MTKRAITKRDGVSVLATLEYETMEWRVTILDEEGRLVHWCHVRGWVALTTEMAILLAMRSWREGNRNGVTI